PLGWRAIGGPAVHVALMEREVVRRRHWLERAEFSRLFAACNLLPGPGSTQLALLLGLRRAGVSGMLLAALLFIGPAVLVMLGLAELYLHVGADRHVQLVLLGVDAAVVGIVARAAVDLSALGQRGLVGVAIAAAALAGGILGVNPIAMLAGGAVIGYLAWELNSARGGRNGGSRLASALPWLAAVPAPAITAGLLPLALTFLKIGAVAFGSGYVLLPFLHADFVGGSFHLTDRQVADAFAVSQVTPGPVFAVAAFLGVQVSGIGGGVVAALAIFAPSLVFVPLVDVVVRITEARPGIRAALDGVVVAAVGLIASACVALARVSFAGPIEVVTAVAVFAMLWRWPRGQPLGVAVGILAGLLVTGTTH
ncbi:MAG TPA: chromate efflux transporter, partial [Candidatus Dormibacteraeota bacterium]|nr:chromate efflux transporter [Candidatus Dormibacteraeota bacterium]